MENVRRGITLKNTRKDRIPTINRSNKTLVRGDDSEDVYGAPKW